MLKSYPEIRDRIYVLARQRNLRVDWIETTPFYRDLVLYDSRQVPVARATVPLRHTSQSRLEQLSRRLEGVFGERWME